MTGRKIGCILLSAILLFSCTACSSGKKDEGNTSSSGTSDGTAQKATVDIFQFKVEVHDALRAATEAYMKEKPNVKINLETVGGGDDYGAALRTKMASSDQPEIYNIGGPQDVKDWAGKLEDLSDQPWVPYVVEGLLDDVTLDGKIYGLPFGIEGYGLLYNKRIFEAAGIDGEKLSTYDEIDSAFASLQQKIDAGELKDQFPVLEAVTEYPVKEKWVVGLHTANIALGQEFDSAFEAYEAKTVDFTYADQLKDLIDLQVKYSSNADNPAALNAVDYSMQIGGGFAIERVAVVQQGNWVYGEVRDVDEEVAQNMGIIPLPLKGVSEGNIPVGVPMYWAVNSESSDADKAAALDFLNWLYQSDAGKKIVVQEMGFIPAFTNYGDIQPEDPIGKTINEYANAGKTSPWVFMGEPTGWGENTLGVGIQQYVAGEKSWEDVIRESKTAWEEARK